MPGKALGIPAATLLEAARGGDRRALARLLTLLDNDDPRAHGAASACAAKAGRAAVIGITGVAGSGKSTLVNALLGAWLGDGRKVAVVAVDPSSPVSGGAVLGDRVRMGENGAHPDVFIRSLSARGELGGLSRTTRSVVDCLDACGFDRVIVETVGSGQSETRITGLADTRIVVCPPGLGDEVQAIKAGTLEIADVLAISKGDQPLAGQTAREMRDMLGLRRNVAAAWQPRVVVVCAPQPGGIDELLAAIDAHALVAGRGRRLRAQAPAAGDRATPTLSREPPAAAEAPAWRARLAALAEGDGLCATLGISLVAGNAGQAEAAMTIDARHMNFNGAGHGGAIFALADSAFGLASNSHGPVAAGIDAHITYQTGVARGDRLVARALEVHRTRRIAVYRIDVLRAEADGGETAVSSFTGTVYIRG